jgi:hypothetical protein
MEICFRNIEIGHDVIAVRGDLGKAGADSRKNSAKDEQYYSDSFHHHLFPPIVRVQKLPGSHAG